VHDEPSHSPRARPQDPSARARAHRRDARPRPLDRGDLAARAAHEHGARCRRVPVRSQDGLRVRGADTGQLLRRPAVVPRAEPGVRGGGGGGGGFGAAAGRFAERPGETTPRAQPAGGFALPTLPAEGGEGGEAAPDAGTLGQLGLLLRPPSMRGTGGGGGGGGGFGAFGFIAQAFGRAGPGGGGGGFGGGGTPAVASGDY